MGNAQKKTGTNGKHSKKHRKLPNSKLMEEMQEEMQGEKPELEEPEEIEEQSEDTGGQHQDRTSEDGGAADKGEGEIIRLITPKKKKNGRKKKKNSKLMEETQGKKPEPEEQEKIEEQSDDTGGQHQDQTSVDGGAADRGADKGEGEEQSDDTGGQHQDRTSEDGGAAGKGEGDLIRLNQKKKKKKGVGNEPLQSKVSVAPLVQVVPRSVEEFVGLNVGGVVYMTSRSTLFRYPDSLLGILFTASVPTPKDGQGNYMIDGDGQMFRHVLNYLRRGALCLPNDFQEHRLLQQEAAFYQLPELQVLISQDLRSKTASTPSGVLVETPIKVGPTKETCRYVIEIFVSEEDNAPQSWRIYGGLNFLENIPTLSDYIDQYRKGSQCLQFTTQHPMFPSNIHRRFPKTTLFYHIFNLGFKLHTSECMEIVDETNAEIPWLRYLFTSTTL